MRMVLYAFMLGVAFFAGGLLTPQTSADARRSDPPRPRPCSADFDEGYRRGHYDGRIEVGNPEDGTVLR